MKLKMVVVDFEIPARVKKWALRAGIPAVILTVAAVAWADSLHTWNTGDTLQAADLNGNFANLQTQITALQAQAHPASAFRADLSGSLAVPNNSAAKTVMPGTVSFDLGSEYTPSTGVFTPKNAGTYLVSCFVQWPSPGTTGGNWNVQIVNDAAPNKSLTNFDVGGNSNSGSEMTSGIVQLTAGEGVKCVAAQSTNVASDTVTTASFSVARLY
ncbi:MAG: hypothetical protein ABI551_17035 [Polyangiaceae bacterium]